MARHEKCERIRMSRGQGGPCPLVVGTASGNRICEVRLKGRMKLSEVVPESGPVTELRSAEFSCVLGGKLCDTLQVCHQVVLNACAVLRMGKGHCVPRPGLPKGCGQSGSILPQAELGSQVTLSTTVDAAVAVGIQRGGGWVLTP